MVLPVPGGPTSNRLWPPAAAICVVVRPLTALVLSGDDNLLASGVQEDLIQITFDGAEGSDVLVGSRALGPDDRALVQLIFGRLEEG